VKTKILALLVLGAVWGWSATDAHADTAGFLCSVMYWPPTDSGGYGQHGGIQYVVGPSGCSSGSTTEFALCSAGATLPLCQSNYSEPQLLAVMNNLVQALASHANVYTYTDTTTFTKAKRVMFR
jgi:hypothetical protein